MKGKKNELASLASTLPAPGKDAVRPHAAHDGPYAEEESPAHKGKARDGEDPVKGQRGAPGGAERHPPAQGGGREWSGRPGSRPARTTPPVHPVKERAWDEEG